jgi:hypothetical protein
MLWQSRRVFGFKPPKCDAPDVRMVSGSESESLVRWLSECWHGWRLRWSTCSRRARRLACDRDRQHSRRWLAGRGPRLLLAESCKTRRPKYTFLPAPLYAELCDCAANGWTFGRFSDELRRRLILLKHRPNHAARTKDFTPKRLVG